MGATLQSYAKRAGSTHMKIIKVKCCQKCPYCHYDNGAGFGEPYFSCEESGIIIDDKIEEEDRWIEMDREIHPKCRLKDAKDECNNK